MTLDRPTSALVASALVGPVLATAGTVAMLAARDDLPERIAVHWGFEGTPDRYASFAGALATNIGLAVLIPVALVALGGVVHRSARSAVGGIVASLGTVCAGIGFGGSLAQRGGAIPTPFPLPWTLGSIGVGAALGIAIARWGRAPLPPLGAPRPPLPEDAARLDVPETTRLAWTGRATLPTRPVLVIAALVSLPLIWLALAVQPWIWLLTLLLAALLVVTFSARVSVDARGLRVSSLGLSWSRVPLERVTSASTATVSPIREFGGWGWRIALDGRRGYVTRAGEALVVHRREEPDVLVTVDDAEGAAVVLNTIVARVR
jgi:uncharacterized membrane protein